VCLSVCLSVCPPFCVSSKYAFSSATPAQFFLLDCKHSLKQQNHHGHYLGSLQAQLAAQLSELKGLSQTSGKEWSVIEKRSTKSANFFIVIICFD
jgi:hypothetical protein